MPTLDIGIDRQGVGKTDGLATLHSFRSANLAGQADC